MVLQNINFFKEIVFSSLAVYHVVIYSYYLILLRKYFNSFNENKISHLKINKTYS